MVLQVDGSYGYVLLSASLTFIVSHIHSFNVSSHRKAAGVPYPLTYATAPAPPAGEDKDSRDSHPTMHLPVAAYRFNCAQRAHANFQEHYPAFIASMLLAGTAYPRVAAVAGVVWSASRVGYMVGYSEGKQGGKGRYLYGGMIFWCAEMVCLGLCIWTGGSGVLSIWA